MLLLQQLMMTMIWTATFTAEDNVWDNNLPEFRQSRGATCLDESHQSGEGECQQQSLS